jgi:hypothetical protein
METSMIREIVCNEMLAVSAMFVMFLAVLIA